MDGANVKGFSRLVKYVLLNSILNHMLVNNILEILSVLVFYLFFSNDLWVFGYTVVIWPLTKNTRNSDGEGFSGLRIFSSFGLVITKLRNKLGLEKEQKLFFVLGCFVAQMNWITEKTHGLIFYERTLFNCIKCVVLIVINK